jgi:hemoglobin
MADLCKLDTAEGSGRDDAAIERAIDLCVRRFYAKAVTDPLLAPIFDGRITDWEHHFSRIADFWSRVLLGTSRYSGHPFPNHLVLPIEPEHFDRWLALFEEAARETLDIPRAELAIARARHMSACFRAGLFPFTDNAGRPSRFPV